MYKLLVCLLLFFLLVIFPTKVWASPETNNLTAPTGATIDEALHNIVPIRYIPGDNLYFLITVKENLSRFFKPSALKRAEFDYILTSKRIKESYRLYEEGMYDQVRKSLSRYSARAKITVEQLEKARSQNQEVTDLASKIADNLDHQEVLLLYLAVNKEKINEAALEDALNSFRSLAEALDNIVPGVINRYELTKDLNSDEELKESTKSAEEETPTPPSSKPFRIIR